MNVDARRPFDTTGMTTERWREIEPTFVRVDDLTLTQPTVDVIALISYAAGHVPASYSGDVIPHVVRCEGRLFLEDGHHRVLVEACRGSVFVRARVLERSA